MNIGFIGRTKMLADTVKLMFDSGFEISFIWTCKSEKHYNYTKKDFKNLSEKLNVDFIYTSNLKEGKKLIKKKPDLIISINFINIIPKVFLNNFKYGILNAHLGDLPRYKGNACPNWAILNNEKLIALSIHKMTEELDSGPIYIKKKYYLNNQTYIQDIYNWAEKITPKLFLETVKKIENGNEPYLQKKIKSMRTYPRKPEDAKINWSLTRTEIHNLIRASSYPFDGAFCFLNNNLEYKIFIFKAELVTYDYDFYAVNGQILSFDKQSIDIAVNNKPLKITEFHFQNENQNETLAIISKSLRNRLT
jgi:methionyl-tRNA formyltransferase